MPRATRNTCRTTARTMNAAGMSSWRRSNAFASAAATASDPVSAIAATQTRRPSSFGRRNNSVTSDERLPSSLEPQEHAADADLVARPQPLSLFDAHAVHERAVRAPEVLDPP